MQEVGNILKCLRKTNHHEESEIAEFLNISLADYISLEKNLQGIALSDWVKLAEFYNISPDVINRSYFDRRLDVKITSQRNNGYLRIPKEYTVNQCLSVRYLSPIIIYLKKKHGPQAFYDIVEKLGIDKSFFYSYDNLLNLPFLNDLINTLETEGLIDDLDIEKMAASLSDPITHGDLCWLYYKAKDELDVVWKYLKYSSRYQCFFNQKIKRTADDKIELFVQVNEAIKEDYEKLGSTAETFVELLRITGIENLPRILENKKEKQLCEIKSIKVKETVSMLDSAYGLFVSNDYSLCEISLVG